MSLAGISQQFTAEQQITPSGSGAALQTNQVARGLATTRTGPTASRRKVAATSCSSGTPARRTPPAADLDREQQRLSLLPVEFQYRHGDRRYTRPCVRWSGCNLRQHGHSDLVQRVWNEPDRCRSASANAFTKHEHVRRSHHPLRRCQPRPFLLIAEHACTCSRRSCCRGSLTSTPTRCRTTRTNSATPTSGSPRGRSAYARQHDRGGWNGHVVP